MLNAVERCWGDKSYFNESRVYNGSAVMRGTRTGGEAKGSSWHGEGSAGCFYLEKIGEGGCAASWSWCSSFLWEPVTHENGFGMKCILVHWKHFFISPWFVCLKLLDSHRRIFYIFQNWCLSNQSHICCFSDGERRGITMAEHTSTG